jgi:hypothetical protein
VGFDIHEMATELNTNSRVVDALLREYESRGFMNVDRMLGGVVHCNLEIRANDFVRYGGYQFEEQIASSQLEKLTLELESLYGAIPNSKYNLIMTSINAIATALSLFKK